MKLVGVDEVPDEITTVLVSAVLMPNGEIIRYGKTLEWFEPGKGVYVHVPDEEVVNE